MSKLVIVESPSKCAKIECYLGFGYQCVATCGHIQKLDFDDIGIEPEQSPNSRVSVRYTKLKNNHIARIKQAIKTSTEVIIACDTDREGESIAAHICWMFKLDIATVKRIRFNEITQSALSAAILAPTTIDMRVVRAQQARQIIDLLIGYKISPTLWTHINTDENTENPVYNPAKFAKGKKSNSSLSAGRCQTPALRIVYDNHQKIESRKSEGGVGNIRHSVTGLFTKFEVPHKLSTEFGCDCKDKSLKRFLEAEHAFPHQLSRSEKTSFNQASPKPLTTSRLIQLASNTLQFSPKQTMDLCQTLYEEGLITYMRTESEKYSTEFIAQASAYIGNTYFSQLSSKPFVDPAHLATITATAAKDSNTSDATNPHEAIRPTDICKLAASLTAKITPNHIKMYTLIRATALESCLPPAQGLRIQSSITSSSLDSVYTAACEQLVFPGWRIVPRKGNNIQRENTEHCPMFQYLLSIPVDAKIPAIYSTIGTTLSIEPGIGHLTEAKLVNMLDSLGIGRPSTFSSLVDKIQLRKYVKKMDIPGNKITGMEYEILSGGTCFLSTTTISKVLGGEKNKLVLQPLGKRVMEFLQTHFNSLFEYSFTSTMEKMLDGIVESPAQDSFVQLEEVCILCNNTTMALVDKLKKVESNMRKIARAKKRPIAVYNGYAVTIFNGKFGLFAKMTPAKTKQDLGPDTIHNRTDKTAYTISLKSLGTKKSAESVCWEEIELIIQSGGCVKK
jgi:DNA topoisomerase I